MTDDRRDPPDLIDPELEALGYVPPDPDERPPVDLWSAVGNVRPWSTLVLLLTWGALFLIMAARHATNDPALLFAWGASATDQPFQDTAWRLLASMFVHAGVAHLASNAASMLVVGPAVERIFTRWGFVVVFTLGGAGASLASLVWRGARDPGGFNLSVGASGAVFALGGALLVAAIRLRHTLAVSRARAFAAAILFLTLPALANGFTRHGTDNTAHAAGLAGGMLLGALLPVDPRLGGRPIGSARRTLGMACALALAAALVLAVRGGWRAG